jgi:hypothetical protein
MRVKLTQLNNLIAGFDQRRADLISARAEQTGPIIFASSPPTTDDNF